MPLAFWIGLGLMVLAAVVAVVMVAFVARELLELDQGQNR